MHYIYLKTYDLKLVIQEPFIQKIGVMDKIHAKK